MMDREGKQMRENRLGQRPDNPGAGIGSHYKLKLDRGMKPTMARLTLARKMAAIVLSIWKKGARFDPGELKQQAA